MDVGARLAEDDGIKNEGRIYDGHALWPIKVAR